VSHDLKHGARFSNGIFTPHKEDVMKKHNKTGNSANQLTYTELKTIGYLKPSEDKAPRPLPSYCAGWPQQQ
jgi:hypothetical protein